MSRRDTTILPRRSAQLPLLLLPPRAEVRRAYEILARVGIAEKLYDRTDRLSGGQQQRVAIARALVGQPRVLLADEPTGNLDSVRSREIAAMLREFNRQKGITIVMVTHEPEMAAYADRQIHFQDGTITMDKQNGETP